MQKFKVSKRLMHLKEYAEKLEIPNLSIVDVGTDHGYLPLICFQSEIIKQSILCDVNKGPLDHAVQTFSDSPYKKYTSFRLGSGLEPIEVGEAELIFIAGMGGGLIRHLLANDLDKTLSFSYYILQPMTEQSELRAWLLDHDFNILWDGFMQESGKHYEIMVVSSPDVKGPSHRPIIDIPSSDLEFGVRVLLEEKQAYLEFLKMKQKKYQAIITQIKSNRLQNEAEIKINMCEDKLESILKIKHLLGLS